ncbi:MAG: MarR family transcriptional regulator [Hyphomicrobiales bacterium]|nr:MAG: MarR family transcriptional regulator [Hyphomicrobiales bacterium]
MIDSRLFLWLNILVMYVRSDRPNLSNTQLAILLIVYMTPGPHYNIDLAARLQIRKNSVPRIVTPLVDLGYLSVGRHIGRRATLILPTADGAAFLDSLRASLAKLPCAPSVDAELVPSTFASIDRGPITPHISAKCP